MKNTVKFRKKIFIAAICTLPALILLYSFGGLALGVIYFCGYLLFPFLLFVLLNIYMIRLLWLIIINKGIFTETHIEEVSEYSLTVKDLNTGIIPCVVIAFFDISHVLNFTFYENIAFAIWMSLPQLFWWKKIRESLWWSFFISVVMLCEMWVWLIWEDAKKY
jgi:hypothetical protein